MKIIIPTIGMRGDVQPYIALALGLGQAGHTVTLATHPCKHGLVESTGVDFAPSGPTSTLASKQPGFAPTPRTGWSA